MADTARAALDLMHQLLDEGFVSQAEASAALGLPPADDRAGYRLGLRTAVDWLHRHRFLYAGDMLAQAFLLEHEVTLAQPLTTPLTIVPASATIAPVNAPIDLLGDENDEARIELLQEQQEHALDLLPSMYAEHGADL